MARSAVVKFVALGETPHGWRTSVVTVASTGLIGLYDRPTAQSNEAG